MGGYPVQLPTCSVFRSSSIKTFGVALFQVCCFSSCLIAHSSFPLFTAVQVYLSFTLHPLCATEVPEFSCLCPGIVRKCPQNENKCWLVFFPLVLSQFWLALMSSLNTRCEQQCLGLTSSGVAARASQNNLPGAWGRRGGFKGQFSVSAA